METVACENIYEYLHRTPWIFVRSTDVLCQRKSSLIVWSTGYINEAGDLNLRRFEAFMKELAKIDKEKFQDTYADLKYFEGKTGRRPNANERKEVPPLPLNIHLHTDRR